MENQKSFLMEYVSSRPYLTLTDIYMDNGFTGTDFERPEFNRMLEDAKKGRINCILVKDLSRLGRNYVEAGAETYGPCNPGRSWGFTPNPTSLLKKA